MAEKQDSANTARFTALLTSGGQLTVPKHIRDTINVERGDTLELYAKQYDHDAEVVIEE